MIRLIASDMDGTFFDEKSQVPAGSFELIRELREAGVYFCVSSGRTSGFLETRFAEVWDEISLVCANGTHIYVDGELVARHTFNHNDLNSLADYLEDFAYLHLDVSDSDHDFLLDKNPEKIQRFLDYCPWAPSHVGDGVPDDVEITAASINVSDESVDVAEVARDLEKQFGDRLQFMQLAVPVIDISPPGISKAGGIREVMQHFDIEDDEVVVYGDSMNDYPMMSEFSHAVAPANAFPKIIELAERVVPANTEQGVQADMRAILEAAEASPKDVS